MLFYFDCIIDISLRGLLNTQNQQNPGQSPHMGGFNGPPNYTIPSTGPPGQPPPGHSPMRPHFLTGPPQHQNFGQGQSPAGNANYMAANGPRFQNFPRMQGHPAGMAPQQGPPAMRPMMQNVSLL